MSTLTVTAERLVIHDHPNADALELAQVGLYRAVVPKGVYRTGDYAVYIPEQAVLPEPLIEELGLVGRLAGKAHNRVKAVRLRGELSQGIVCRPEAIDVSSLWAAATMRTDFAEQLGITKWVPEVPTMLDGVVESAPDLMPWIEIENLKRYPGIFRVGEPIIATEKVHGSACLVTIGRDGQALVSSKGHGAKSLAIVEADSNLYWRAVRGYGIAEVGERIRVLLGATRVGIFGEVYGPGVQDLTYGTDRSAVRPGYAVFDVRVDHDGALRWLDQDEVFELLDGELPLVPRIAEGPFDAAELMALAEGCEQVSGTEAHLREGLVIRPKHERYSTIIGGRAIAKIVTESYLTRKGGSEYE